VYDPRREESVIQNVLQHNTGPLSNEAARRLFERIIDESRAQERQTYQANANEPDE
jgi:chorismate mutase